MDPAPGTIFDREEFLRRLGGDEELYREVLQVFLEDCPNQMDVIRTAMDTRDPMRIRSAAHALKGAAGSVSARALFEASGALERAGAGGDLDACDQAWQQVQAAASVLLDRMRAEVAG
ncbi:MAG: Hpt domain-containing protein [Acidimicrobiia bacterium]|nr:Hpt domain-containing protein [Acidimicrobiia bacterium]